MVSDTTMSLRLSSLEACSRSHRVADDAQLPSPLPVPVPLAAPYYSSATLKRQAYSKHASPAITKHPHERSFETNVGGATGTGTRLAGAPQGHSSGSGALNTVILAHTTTGMGVLFDVPPLPAYLRPRTLEVPTPTATAGTGSGSTASMSDLKGINETDRTLCSAARGTAPTAHPVAPFMAPTSGNGSTYMSTQAVVAVHQRRHTRRLAMEDAMLGSTTGERTGTLPTVRAKQNVIAAHFSTPTTGYTSHLAMACESPAVAPTLVATPIHRQQKHAFDVPESIHRDSGNKRWLAATSDTIMMFTDRPLAEPSAPDAARRHPRSHDSGRGVAKRFVPPPSGPQFHQSLSGRDRPPGSEHGCGGGGTGVNSSNASHAIHADEVAALTTVFESRLKAFAIPNKHYPHDTPGVMHAVPTANTGTASSNTTTARQRVDAKCA